MRILIVSQYFAPESFKINDLVRHLKARGHELEVVTGMPNYPLGKFYQGYGLFKKWTEIWDGVRIVRSPIWPRRRGGAFNLSLNYLSYVLSATFLGLPRLSGRFDCAFAFSVSPITSCLPAIFYKWVTGTPVVIWVQDLWPESVRAVGAIRNPILMGLLESLVRFIYRNSDVILIQSEAFRTDVSRRTDDPRKVHYFPNWAEDLYKPVQRADVTGPARDLPAGFKVVFAGNIGKAQSMETLIKAAGLLREHEDIRWIIVGDGSERETTEAQIRELGLSGRVHFTGRLPAESMPEYFAMGDALLVFLKRDPIFSYTIPSRLQSYWACARPVIAALDGEGQRVILESGGGLVGATEDEKALAENVLAVYKMSPEQREEMGQKGLAYYRRHFDREPLLLRLEALLSAMVKKK